MIINLDSESWDLSPYVHLGSLPTWEALGAIPLPVYKNESPQGPNQSCRAVFVKITCLPLSEALIKC